MIFLCDNFVKISMMKRHSLRALTIHAAEIRSLVTHAGSRECLRTSVCVHTHTCIHTYSSAYTDSFTHHIQHCIYLLS